MSDSYGPTEGGYGSEEAWALEQDAGDVLRGFRDRFVHPSRPDGRPALYFCGNSLGLQPREARDVVLEEMDAWGRLPVDGHFEKDAPWYSYHEVLRAPMAGIVGAKPQEVVAMNGLTVNLHLLMVSFYRPTPRRYKILIEGAAFPSDGYAVRSQIRFHGHDPSEALLVAAPRPGEDVLRTEDVVAMLDDHGDQIALVLMSGVHYYTGQAFDIARITASAQEHGCAVGWDLAHAAGNVPLRLHDWDVDFAAWCTYKYLNGGPGSLAGCFVHERHAHDPKLPRFAGWWGNDPATRFRMHLQPEFVPAPGADGWQLSNPPILAAAPLRVSLALFEDAGMAALRRKSERLTGYLEYLVRREAGDWIDILTPSDPAARGCQLSLRTRGDGRALFRALERDGVVGDFREPDVIRVAPVPLYNSFHEVWRFAQVLRRDARPAGAGR